MSRMTLSRTLLAAGALASAASPLLAGVALAQSAPIGTDQRSDYDPRAGSYSPRTPDYRRAPDYQQDRDDERDYAPPPEPAPPPNYDGTRLPPPPPGYVAAPDERRESDERYAYEAERWARDNCLKSQSNAGGGALIGGLLGAVIGSSVAGRHDRGAGALIGGAFGAIGGAAVGSASANETSPGCPPGYSVRRGYVEYRYSGPDYYYAAPGWYRPWVLYEGRWTYRLYPYHGWYYRNYRGGNGGDRYHFRNGAPRGPEGWRDHGGWGHRGY